MKPKFKNKIIKGLAISMAFSMLFTTNAFATPIVILKLYFKHPVSKMGIFCT